jgi:NTE family protein
MTRIAAAIITVALVGCASAPVAEHPPRAEPLVPLARADRPAVAVVLGSGAARGFAHVGALKALDDAGVPIDLVVGTSAGSLVGALYAGGIRGDALVNMALGVQRGQLVDLVAFPKRGFIDGDKLEFFVNRSLGSRAIEQLELPFVAVATELRTGALTAFNRGDTGMAVRASCSVPAVFHPTMIDGHEYVDGSLVSPVPVRVARSLGADIVIAVDVSMQPTDRRALGNPAALVTQAFVVMAGTMAKEETRLADVVVQPDLAGISVTDFAARERAIAAGEEAVRTVLPAIQRLVAQKTAAKSAPAQAPATASLATPAAP